MSHSTRLQCPRARLSRHPLGANSLLAADALVSSHTDLLFTEAIVAVFSLWVGFAWGFMYLTLRAVPLVFGQVGDPALLPFLLTCGRAGASLIFPLTTLLFPTASQVYGFTIGQVGLVFFAFCIGACIGWVANLYQEKLYQKHYAKRGPEARLLMAMLAGLVFPGEYHSRPSSGSRSLLTGLNNTAGIFTFAFASGRGHWIGPVIGFVMVSGQRAGLRASSAESQTINPLRTPADPLRRLLHLPRHLQLPSRLVHDLRIECAVRAVALP